jgi:hypothetical protein
VRRVDAEPALNSLTLLQPLRLQARFTGVEQASLCALLGRLTISLTQQPHDALSALRALYQELGQWPAQRLPDDFATGTNLKRASVAELDDYMHVVRVDSDVPAAAWLRSMIEAQAGWLELVQKGNGDAVELRRVATGFQAMHLLTARALEGEVEALAPHPALLQPKDAVFEAHELLDIWRKGHWIFFVLTQALTIAFRRLVDVLQNGDTEAARVELSAATDLFWASGASMKLTGAFTNEQYHSDVRPTMTLGAETSLVKTTSLSGAMTWDHHYLVNRVWREELMPLLGSLPPSVKDLYPEFLRAYREGLSLGHRAVCAKFGGETMGSLVAPKHIATELLDNIETTRLAQLSLDRASKP